MKRILVGLDSSPRASTVLAAALHLATVTGAKLVVYRAIGVPPDLPKELLTVSDQRLEDVLERDAREDLARLVANVPPERIERIATAFATPWDGICRAATEYDADLIVIGSHGYGGLDRLLGTNAAKVVNRADRNVLVVRAPL
jgi:universal stress protein F